MASIRCNGENRSKTVNSEEKMFNKEREQEILSILKSSNGFVSVKQLCDTLFASESSIRRDLRSLEEHGLIKRSYGGASPAGNYSSIVTFDHRTRQSIAAKREIAKKAAGLIKDGSIVFLDQSSSAYYLAEELVNRSSVTVVTNNIEIMMLLSHSAIKLISSGGFLSEENRNCLIGADAQRTFEQINADLAFFSVKAIGEDGAISDCSREEVVVRESMIRNAEKKVLLCDSSKFFIKAPYRQCTLRELDYLISEGDHAKAFSHLDGKTKLL